MDGFAGVFVFKGRSDFTGVVFTTHGPAHFGGLFPVSLFVVDGGLESRLGGRGKGRSTGEKSGEDEELVLSLTQDPKRYVMTSEKEIFQLVSINRTRKAPSQPTILSLWICLFIHPSHTSG